MNTETSPHDPPDLGFASPSRVMIDITPPGQLSQATMRAVHSELEINDLLPDLSIHEPTALLLDINNLFRRAKDVGLRVDYSRLKTIFENRCDLRHCAAFSAVDRADRGATEWERWMIRMGYDFRGKDLVRYTGNDGRAVSKGNMDVEITLEAVKLSDAFTHVIIGTCDGDFIPLIQELQKNPVRKVSVLGISGPTWSGMSRTLANEAHNFYDLYKLQEHVNFVRER